MEFKIFKVVSVVFEGSCYDESGMESFEEVSSGGWSFGSCLLSGLKMYFFVVCKWYSFYVFYFRFLIGLYSGLKIVYYF